jgi:protein-S-isoprenylcysteine O-methyltransferase Ste14
MFDILAGIVGLAYFLSISIATRQHFKSDRYPLGMYVISTLSLVGLTVFLTLAFQGQLVFVGACLALTLVAQALFAWAIRHSRDKRLTLALDDEMQSETIIRTGPWRYMRHPFLRLLHDLLAGLCAGDTAPDIGDCVPDAFRHIHLFRSARGTRAEFGPPPQRLHRISRNRWLFLSKTPAQGLISCRPAT